MTPTMTPIQKFKKWFDENKQTVMNHDISKKITELITEESDKKYTEEDLRKAFFEGGIDLASNYNDEAQYKKFLKSINK